MELIVNIALNVCLFQVAFDSKLLEQKSVGQASLSAGVNEGETKGLYIKCDSVSILT